MSQRFVLVHVAARRQTETKEQGRLFNETGFIRAARSASRRSLPPAFSAQAQTASPFLQRLDANNDGTVSRDEIVAARAKLFARLDANGDGVIDEDETEWLRDAIMDRATALQARLVSEMRRIDASGDGKVSRTSFATARSSSILPTRDGDGKLSAVEFSSSAASWSVAEVDRRYEQELNQY
ncbi:EF-hand domain-containing protein [Sinorhizobium meliloti]|uniref:EF-hand domain-containing protein n=1 Tax=Rhizobium meliloti TaxID=382 RepID=UPI001F3F4100|nr:hypothetical protein [Sinorhizobium meliloti]